MTTIEPKMTQGDDDESRKRRLRSPAYPYINLETAIARAQSFYDREGRNSAPIAVAAGHWNYETKSSAATQTAAALMSFGLMSDEGTGSKRRLKLTQDGLRILIDKRPDSTERTELIKRAALAPKIHQQIWEKWGNEISDSNLRHSLIFEWKPPFNENSVDGFIKELWHTIGYAKLTGPDKVAEDDGDQATYSPKVGEYVQWESGGVLQFPEPKQLRELSDDGAYGFVDGSHTGLPISQIRRANAPTQEPGPMISPTAPLKTKSQEVAVTLSAGRGVFQWPSSLTKEDILDLIDTLKIIERKISRPVSENSQRDKSE